MRLLSIALLLGLGACGGNGAATAPPDMCTPVGGSTMYKLTAKIQLTDDGMGVPFFTQNGSTVHVDATTIANKTFYWATLKGGDQVSNGKMIEIGSGTIAPDLTATVTTGAMYNDGPWEFATFVSLTGGDPTQGPQAGDLAGFDLTTPPPCEPPPTGVSVRFTIGDADAMLLLTNRYFIRF